MPLSDSIAALTRHLTTQVWVNGVLLRPGNPTDASGVPGVSSIRISKSYESPVPRAWIGVNRVPEWVQPGQFVKVFLGYDGSTSLVFTGHVQSRDRRVGRSTILAAGKLFNIFRKSEIAERDVDQANLNIAIQTLLTAAGISTLFQFITVPTPVYQIGGVATIDAKLERMTVSQMLQKLMDLEGLRITEWGNGVIRVEKVDLIPAGRAFKTYDTTNSATPHILEGGTEEDPGAIKTKVIVTGATVISGTPPNETSEVITSAPAVITDISLVQPLLGTGEHIEVEYSNHLIDTVEKADEIAHRLITELGRVPRTTTIKIPGDPELELGVTLALDFPEIDLEGNFIVASLQHEVTPRGYSTVVGLIGGEGAGISIGQAPRATFTIDIVRQVFQDKVWAFVTFDASLSHDPDGSIVSYTWSDNKTTFPEIGTLTDKIITVRVDPTTISSDWDVTLVVTDNAGLTSDPFIMSGIDVPATSTEVRVPAVFAAADIAMASPDGGQTWNDFPFIAEVRSVAARPPDGVNVGHACYGTVDGRILKTEDFLTTPPGQALGGAGAQVEDIAWDWRQLSAVWAVTTTGKVYRSIDFGVSFQLYEDLRVKLGLPDLVAYHIGLPGLGGLWIYGGTGAGTPLIVYVRETGQHTWTTINMLSGELGADLTGPAGIHIIDAQDNGRGSFVMILAGTGFDMYPVYQCSTPLVTNPAWKRPSGISIALTEGRYVVGDAGTTFGAITAQFHAAFDDRDVYHSANGINWIKSANVMPVGVTPEHAIWTADEIHGTLYASVHVIAGGDAGGDEGIYVSSDGLQTLQTLRPATGFPSWPTGNPAHQVALGPSPGGPGRIITVSEQPADSSRWVSRKIHNPNWQHEDIPTLLSSSMYNRLRALTSLVWFVFGFDARTDYASVVPMRTADGGDTFAEMAAPDTNYKFVDVARAASGRMWGLAIDTGAPANVRVYYSDDGGADATWTRSTNFAQSQGTHGLCTIVCHPTNSRRITVLGHKDTNDIRTVSTIDEGTAWTTKTALGITASSDRGVQADYLMAANDSSNNRLTGLIPSVGNHDEIRVSDDAGTTWEEKWPLGDPLGVGSSGDFIVGPVKDYLGVRYYAVLFDDVNNHVYVLQSIDGGEVWDRMTQLVSGEDPGEQPSGGVAYDAREAALYIKWSGGHTEERRYVYRMSPIVMNIGYWTDQTGDIFPPGVTSLANSGICQSIAIVP